MVSMHKKLFVFLLIFSSSVVYSTKKEASEAALINDLKEKVKQEEGACDARPLINNLVQKALKQCGIKQSVLVFETERSNSGVVGYPFKSPQLFMYLGSKGFGSKKTVTEYEATIYHEIGHIANGDQSKEAALNDEKYEKKVQLGILPGLFSGIGIYKYAKKMPALCPLVGGLVSATIFVGAALLRNYKNSLEERNADSFAYKNLLRHGKLKSAISKIYDHLVDDDEEDRKLKESPFFTGYPRHWQRAKLGLDILQDQGITLADMTENFPTEVDPKGKKRFKLFLESSFPRLKGLY